MDSEGLPFVSGLKLPLICAPMFLVSGPGLVVAALNAGIVGAMPAGTFRTSREFEQAVAAVAAARSQLQARSSRPAPPFAVNLSLNARRRLGAERFDADFDICRRHQVPIIITTSGDPASLVKRVHDWGGSVLHDVTTIAHARKAAAAGVDGLILVCGGGGGHSGLLSPFVFLPAVRRFFDRSIVLAGALASGEAILSAQALGASLCYMGTRFIATKEALADTLYKNMLVEAEPHDLTYTPALTRGVPANFLNASIVRAGLDPRALPPDAAAVPDGARAWRDIWSAGQAVSLIDDVPSVGELVERLLREYEEARGRLSAQLSSRI